MLKTILSITGRPGLFKIVSQGKNMIIIESLLDGKRFPAHSRDKIVSLGDIAIYTNTEEVSLTEVFEKAYAHTQGKSVDVKALIDAGTLRSEFEAILPDYDQERVYDNDIKKFFTWFNLLLNAGFTTFVEKESENNEAETENSSED